MSYDRNDSCFVNTGFGLYFYCVEITLHQNILNVIERLLLILTSMQRERCHSNLGPRPQAAG